MQNSKAIRPEIKGLFEQIRIQAEKYTQAFDLLESHRNEYIELSSALKSISEEVYANANHDMHNLKLKYDDLIKLLKIENSKVIQKYSQLQDLKSLQDSYFTSLESIKIIQNSLDIQNSILKNAIDDYTNSINELKSSAISKVNEIIEESMSNLNSSIKQQYQSFEDKIVKQVRHVEGKIINNDEIYFAFQERYRLDLKNLTNEIDEFRRNFVKLEIARNNPNDPSSIKGAMNDLNEKLERLENDVNSIVLSSSNKKSDKSSSDDKKHETQTHTSGLSKNYDSAISQLKNNFASIEKKSNNVMIISIVAIVTSLLAIVVSFIL